MIAPVGWAFGCGVCGESGSGLAGTVPGECRCARTIRRTPFFCLAMVGAGIAYGMAVTSASAHQGPARDRALDLVRACGVEPVNFMKWGACECCRTFVVRTRCPTCYRDLCPSCISKPTCAHSVDGNHDDA